MMVTVRLPPPLLRYAGDHAYLDVPAETVTEALEAICRLHPELRTRLLADDGTHLPHLSVFRGDARVERSAAHETTLRPDDVVTILVGIAGGADDVRMKGFRSRVSVGEAFEAALDGVRPLPPVSAKSLGAVGRVLAEPVTADVDVPGFRRATMDGYALHASDTFGATPYAPIALQLEGEATPGRSILAGPGANGAVSIMTGAPVPADADAVLRAEDATRIGDVVEVRTPVATGRNVGRIGEDVLKGSVVFESGRRLRVADIGLLAAIGVEDVAVHRRPRVRVIVSGDELLAPGAIPSGTRIVDSNSPMLAALIERDGGVVAEVLRLPDGREPMREALSLDGADVVLTAGAASVGKEDHTPGLVADVGELTVHGVAMRPSSPTGIGRIKDRPVFLLPGNPVSCLVAYDFFAGPAIRMLGGRSVDWPYSTVRLPLSRRIVSQIGRTDYVRVRVRDGLVEPMAIGGASVLSSVTRADGFVIVPAGSEGYPASTEVDVGLYEDRS